MTHLRILPLYLINRNRDAANLLKPALARGQFRCIGATTLAEYREHIEKDGALERRFATVRFLSHVSASRPSNRFWHPMTGYGE